MHWAVLTAAIVAGGAEETPPSVDAVRDVLIRSVETGREVTVYIRLMGMPTRARAKAASRDDLTVEASGITQSIPWGDLSNRSLATATIDAAETAEDFLSIARFCADAGLKDKAKASATRALELDETLKEKVAEFLESLEPQQKRPTIDLDKALGSVAADPEEIRKARRPVNHAGRMLPAMPPFNEPVLFNTPRADAIVSSMQVFPKNNPWNRDISKNPVHPRSEDIIANISTEGTLEFNWDMGYVLVPPGQKRVQVRLAGYGGESDPGPFPVPDNAPIEGWPVSGGDLEALQRSGSGDRHVIVVDPVSMMLYEFFHTFRDDAGWRAACAAKFDLKTNAMRPRGWTSSDAAGLPIFPAVVRFDECDRGEVEHALRVTVRHTRAEFLYPARHHASVPHTTDPTVPAMGQRLRLKAQVDISHLPTHARAVARGLKKYGMFVADNGGNWRISVAPDKRIQNLRALSQLKGSDFEVVVTLDEYGKPQY